LDIGNTGSGYGYVWHTFCSMLTGDVMSSTECRLANEGKPCSLILAEVLFLVLLRESPGRTHHCYGWWPPKFK